MQQSTTQQYNNSAVNTRIIIIISMCGAPSIGMEELTEVAEPPSDEGAVAVADTDEPESSPLQNDKVRKLAYVRTYTLETHSRERSCNDKTNFAPTQTFRLHSRHTHTLCRCQETV